jgi:hypothetical protein
MIYSNQYNSHKWNYKNADWKGFTNACDNKFSCNMTKYNADLLMYLLNLNQY